MKNLVSSSPDVKLTNPHTSKTKSYNEHSKRAVLCQGEYGVLNPHAFQKLMETCLSKDASKI